MSEENMQAAEAVEEQVVEESTQEEQVEASAEESNEEITEESSEDSAVEVQSDNDEDFVKEVEQAQAEGASEEEVQEMIRQYTLKVDGKEFVKEIDLNDEEAIKRELQLSHKGRQAMQELQELKNAYRAELEKIFDNPFEALQALNPEFDPLAVTTSYIDKLTEQSQLSPEEQAEIQRQQEFEALREERDRLKREAEERVAEAERMRIAEEIQTDIMSALDSDPDLVADRETVALVAENLMWAHQKGMDDITAKDVLPTVKETIRRNFQKYANRFKSVDSLKNHMGNDVLEKLREARAELANKQVSNTASIEKGKIAPKKEEPKDEPKIPLSSLFGR